MVHAAPTRLQTDGASLDMIQDLTCLDMEATVSPFIMECCSKYTHLQISFEAPFSWLQSIKTHWFPSNNMHIQRMVLAKQPSKTQLSAAFYPKQEELRSAILYQIGSLVNNTMQASYETSKELHEWLNAMPMNGLVHTVEALPATIFDALRETLFVLAVVAGHADIVSAMLALHLDPNQPLITDSWNPSPRFPFEYAVENGHFLVAKTLLVRLLRGSTQSFKSKLLYEVVRDHSSRHESIRLGEKRELVCLLLDAGAIPNDRCAGILGPHFSFIGWIQSSKCGLVPWLQLALAWVQSHRRAKPPFFDRIRGMLIDNLRYLLVQRLEDLRKENSDLKMLLSKGLRLSLAYEDKYRIEIILSAMTTLGCRDDSDYASSDPTDIAYTQACKECDWASAAHNMIRKEYPVLDPRYAPPPSPSWPKATDKSLPHRLKQLVSYNMNRDNMGLDDRSKELSQKRVQDKYDELTCDISFAGYDDDCSDTGYVRRAFKIWDFRMIAIFHKFPSYRFINFLIALENADVSVCSDFLLSLPAWRPLLRPVREHDDIGDLAAMIHQNSQDFFGEEEDLTGDSINENDRQICLRLLSYYAITTNDRVLLRRLLHIGLDMDEFIFDDRQLLMKTGNIQGHSPQPTSDDDDCGVIPSLLSVAVGQGDLTWIENLRAEGANMRDSMALLWAVKIGATIEVIHTLLQAAKRPAWPTNDAYGSAALRAALRSRRLDIAAILCEEVNINAIELSTVEWLRHANAVTPLGEAVLSDDLQMARWLLEHGADPNRYVAAFGTLHTSVTTTSLDTISTYDEQDSFLPLETPLLAAIRKSSLEMIKILVEFGATIEDARKSGQTRTPLQRAAELGHFDIVKYFIEQEALIDTTPAYSGGTALQLAAMSGHVGIATLLLEKGADPNHLPARGDGRTAFEAAIEWGRVDMVSLLMRSGVDLNLRVGDPLETQYERAQRFAVKNGKFASKREAERLYEQVQAHERLAETSTSSLRIVPADEIWSPESMPEPTW